MQGGGHKGLMKFNRPPPVVRAEGAFTHIKNGQITTQFGKELYVISKEFLLFFFFLSPERFIRFVCAGGAFLI